MKSREQILEEIQPAVEKACSYIAGRFDKALVLYEAYQILDQEELGRREVLANFQSLCGDLVEILQKPEFPKPIYPTDLNTLTHEELEDRRLTRSHFMNAVAGNLRTSAEDAYGPFSYFLEDLSMRIITDSRLMFPDLPVCSRD